MKPPVEIGGSSRSKVVGDFHRGTSVLRAPLLDAGVTQAQISGLAIRLRAESRETLTPARVAVALGEACELWRDRGYAARRETIGEIAAAWGWTEALLDESIDALLAPLSRAALENFARNAPRRRNLIGLIMPGNVPGAGIHEFAIGLIAGCALMVKTATAEPVFFARFTRTLRETDAEVGERVAVLNWSRERGDLTAALRANCDWIAAFGDDNTIEHLESAANLASSEYRSAGPLMAGFGSRVSGVIVSAETAVSPAATVIAQAIARDVSLFEQQGCLSPHHVFVESQDGRAAQGFARELAGTLERFAARVPPPRRYGLEEAAAVRRVRESARWRGIGGGTVALLEGGGIAWTVICDDEAVFTASPGYRTVTISPIADLDDLRRRLAPVAGRIEAFAIAAPAARRETLHAFMREFGICYLCEPGAMQSPPLDWRHGGGVFIGALESSR